MSSRKFLKRFPRLYAAYQGYRAGKHLNQTAVKTPHGFLLAGNTAMQSGDFEPIETRLIQSLLPDVDVLVNVGANIGYYCCLALNEGTPAIAFEPMPGNLSSLMRNMEANGWEKQIELFPIALGDQAGLVRIFGGGTGASLVQGWAGQSLEDSIIVPISTLDLTLGDRLRQQRCLILVDVEGAELAMLKGATKLLANAPRPTWLVEITVEEHQPAGVKVNPHLLETFELFDAAGYKATTVEEDPREIEISEIVEVARTGNDTLKTHNFLFRGE